MGCLTIEVNGESIGTSVSVRYIVGVRHSGVVVKRVPLYTSISSMIKFCTTNLHVESIVLLASLQILHVFFHDIPPAYIRFTIDSVYREYQTLHSSMEFLPQIC